MATSEEYATWIVNNADKKGTPEFNTVSAAYQDAKINSGKQPSVYQSQAQSQGNGTNFLAGIGGSMYGKYLALKQMTGQATPDEVEEYKQSMSGLNSTKSGMAGNITGEVATMAPLGAGVFGAGVKGLSALKLANAAKWLSGLEATAKGRAALAAVGGATQGAMQPVGEGESRGTNAGVGLALGAAGSAVGDKVIKTIAGSRGAAAQQRDVLAKLADPDYRANIQADITVTLKNAGMDFDAMGQRAKEMLTQQAARAIESGAKLDAKSLARQATLASQPIPMKGTKGQLGQNFYDQQTERMVADIPVIGSSVRNRLEDQQGQLVQNMDMLKSGTGGTAKTEADFGRSLRGNIADKYAATKSGVRAAYKEADDVSGGNVTQLGDDVLKWFEHNQGFEGVGGLLTKAKGLGIVSTDDAGNLVANPTTMRSLYELRRDASVLAKDPGTKGHYGGEFKKKIDDIFTNDGGQLYRDAAKLRAEQGAKFESGPAVISQILKKRAGSTTDPSIRPEALFDRLIINGSQDDLLNLRKFLLTGDKTERTQGMQLIRDLRSQTVKHLQDAATRKGQSPTVLLASLENAYSEIGPEKMAQIFGKGGADKMNSFLESAKIISKTKNFSSPGSPTASKIAMMMTNLANTLEKLPIVGGVSSKVATLAIAGSQAKGALKTPAQDIYNKEVANTVKDLSPWVQGAKYGVLPLANQ